MGTQRRPKGLQQHRFVHLAVSSLTEQRTEDNSGSETRAKTNDKDKTRDERFLATSETPNKLLCYVRLPDMMVHGLKPEPYNLPDSYTLNRTTLTCQATSMMVYILDPEPYILSPNPTHKAQRPKP